METEKMSKESFMKEITGLKKVEELHYLLINSLNFILHKGYYYCYCEKFEKEKKMYVLSCTDYKMVYKCWIIKWVTLNFYKTII